MSKKHILSPLIREEDWWAVWFSLLIIVGALVGVIDRVPNLGGWTDKPLSIFSTKRIAESSFRVSDVKDYPKLIQTLQNETESPLVQHLRSSFPPELLAEIDKLSPQTIPTSRLKKAIANQLTKISRGENLYKTEYFVNSGVSSKTLGQAADNPTGVKLIKSNRALLEQAFPDAIGVGKWNISVALVLLCVGLGLLLAVGIKAMGGNVPTYLLGFSVVLAMSIIATFVAHQQQIKAWGLSYALWALALGLLISNTIGTPKWLMAGARCELYIKTGLVLLGAEIIFGKILQLGGPGLFVAWLVTPTVIIFMFWFGVNVLKMKSKALVMIIAAATSVCGVSAAIATAAAARAKKEELTLAVGMTLIFTVLMMVFMPIFIKAIHLSALIGGAWMGGTIDSTGAVVAAGAMLGPQAEMVAAVVKMIQNVLIGVVAFFVAVYWVTRVDRTPDAPKPSLMEIWYRMPKFIVGFVAASVIFSFILIPLLGDVAVEVDIIKDVTKNMRGWLFCMAFVSIGLESNFRDLSSQLVGGKPIILYIVGQSFNLVLTLIAAWLAFGGVLFGKVF